MKNCRCREIMNSIKKTVKGTLETDEYDHDNYHNDIKTLNKVEYGL